MQIRYLSAAEAAEFGAMVHGGSELAELFGTFMLQLTCDTDYDTVTVSFDDETVLRIVVEDSPYVVVMDEESQCIVHYVRDEDNELQEDGQYDFDEDGVETIIDVIASRILTADDVYGEIAHYDI